MKSIVYNFWKFEFFIGRKFCEIIFCHSLEGSCCMESQFLIHTQFSSVAKTTMFLMGVSLVYVAIHKFFSYLSITLMSLNLNP